jgi:hypothetical protein
VYWDGAVLAFTRENAVMLYTAVPDLADQLDRFISDRRNFLPPGLKTLNDQSGQA